MTHAKAWWAAAVVSTLAAVAACSATADALSGNGDFLPVEADGGFGAATPSAGTSALLPQDNAIIIVHAAGAPSFRLCFDAFPKNQPTPDATLMPEANVVGVDVGSAVRIDPLPGVPGKVTLFEEPLIRKLYANNGNGPTCGDLAGEAFAINLDTITTDLSSGVHLLIVEGCEPSSSKATYTAAQCGEDYDPLLGNLHIREQTLAGARRDDASTMPTTVVNLSRALDAFGNGEAVVSYGELDAGGVLPSHVTPQVDSDAGVSLVPTPTLDVDAGIGIYGQYGFRVTVGQLTLAQQSLADIQLFSAPDALPAAYYAEAQNYVLLMLGAPAVLADGGALGDDGGIENDVRQRLHFLVVPVVNPKTDGGAPDAGTDAATL